MSFTPLFRNVDESETRHREMLPEFRAPEQLLRVIFRTRRFSSASGREGFQSEMLFDADNALLDGGSVLVISVDLVLGAIVNAGHLAIEVFDLSVETIDFCFQNIKTAFETIDFCFKRINPTIHRPETNTHLFMDTIKFSFDHRGKFIDGDFV